MQLRKLKGIGEKTEQLFAKLKLYDTDDLLEYYPRNYAVYEQPVYIKDIDNRAVVTIAGVITKTLTIKKMKHLQLVQGVIRDGADDNLAVTWFNMPFLRNQLKPGFHVILRGRLNRKGKNMILEQPEIFTPQAYVEKMNEMQPLYSLTAGLTNKMVQKAVAYALEEGLFSSEFLPEEILKEYDLCAYEDAIRWIHFPKDFEQLQIARKRLAFDEFFLFITTLKKWKTNEVYSENYHRVEDFSAAEKLLQSLPYELTGAQRKVWNEIIKDLSGKKMMNRLVQGDVGSGKTILAFLSLLVVAKNGEQGALMAPTEVLARQHYLNLMELNEKYELGLHPVVLQGSMTAKEKRIACEQIASGEADIIIGTHALIQEKVEYNKLALVITDEQHRFGVKQREMLAQKGEHVHIMVMSATPIPRTLAIILYGELDVSVIDELPANRLPIKNCVVGKKFRPNAYHFIEGQVKEGYQAYVICPMVEESDQLEAENVVDYADMLGELLPEGVHVEYLHGKMRPAQKNEIMQRFADNEIQVLVSTTVVEVGVNVPNATVMMVENAERFGLAALHQLRGRVGRGSAQSYCIFLSTSDKPETMERLDILNRSNDGFYIAREDLKLRGAGDFFGIRQSGDMEFRIGDIYQDSDIITQASEAVNRLHEQEFAVSEEEELSLMARVSRYHQFMMENINL